MFKTSLKVLFLHLCPFHIYLELIQLIKQIIKKQSNIKDNNINTFFILAVCCTEL